jgi:hypothetical protein
LRCEVVGITLLCKTKERNFHILRVITFKCITSLRTKRFPIYISYSIRNVVSKVLVLGLCRSVRYLELHVYNNQQEILHLVYSYQLLCVHPTYLIQCIRTTPKNSQRVEVQHYLDAACCRIH